jgi:hypothetical protein
MVFESLGIYWNICVTCMHIINHSSWNIKQDCNSYKYKHLFYTNCDFNINRSIRYIIRIFFLKKYEKNSYRWLLQTRNQGFLVARLKPWRKFDLITIMECMYHRWSMIISYLHYLCLLLIVVSNTYCVVFLLCFSWCCVPYVASFSGL